MKRLLLGLVCCAGLAFPAGPISIGVKGGVPLTDAFDAVTRSNINYITDTKSFTVGPQIDLNLPFGLGIEFNALYKRLSFEANGNDLNDIFVRRTASVNSWDFPLLLKVRIAPRPVRPYFSVGPTFRHLGGIQDVGDFFTGENVDTRSPRTNNVGFTAGAGLELSPPIIKISPEIRYTRWGWQTFRDPGSAFQSDENQLEFLVGITF